MITSEEHRYKNKASDRAVGAGAADPVIRAEAAREVQLRRRHRVQRQRVGAAGRVAPGRVVRRHRGRAPADAVRPRGKPGAEVRFRRAWWLDPVALQDVGKDRTKLQ